MTRFTTRHDPAVPASAREAGPGFYTCEPCRRDALADGSVSCLHFGTARGGRPHPLRDRGLCLGCRKRAETSGFAIQYPEWRRVAAEALDLPVARLLTRPYCTACNPNNLPRCATAGCANRAAPGETRCPSCLERHAAEELQRHAWGQSLIAPPVPAARAAQLAGLDTENRARVASAASAVRADNTRQAYASQWRRWETWCGAHDIAPLSATPAQVAAYLAERAETAKTATVRVSAAAIAAGYRAAGQLDPTKAPLVNDTLRGIARQQAAEPAAAPRQAAALDYHAAMRLLSCAPPRRRRGRGWEPAAATAARNRRDRTIVALAFCAGLRRAEIAALTWVDVAPTAKPGQLRVRVRSSKTNSTGTYEDRRLLVGVFAAAVDELRTTTAPADTERVIPITPHQINVRMQALAAAAGLGKGISAHSGRRGLATELVRRGASTTAIQQAGGWRSPGMVLRYAAAVEIEDGAVARHLA